MCVTQTSDTVSQVKGHMTGRHGNTTQTFKRHMGPAGFHKV